MSTTKTDKQKNLSGEYKVDYTQLVTAKNIPETRKTQTKAINDYLENEHEVIFQSLEQYKYDLEIDRNKLKNTDLEKTKKIEAKIAAIHILQNILNDPNLDSLQIRNNFRAALSDDNVGGALKIDLNTNNPPKSKKPLNRYLFDFFKGETVDPGLQLVKDINAYLNSSQRRLMR